MRLPAVVARHPGLQPRADWHGVQRCRTAEHPWLPWALLSKCQRFSVEGHLSYGWWLPGTQSVLDLIVILSHYIEPGCAHRVQEGVERDLWQQETEGLPKADAFQPQPGCLSDGTSGRDSSWKLRTPWKMGLGISSNQTATKWPE